MIEKLLIANRGEIAHRILRTAKAMGIGTIAVHSEADARALHVRLADERVSIGPAPPCDSYLKIEQILAAAREMHADAVHPGYGFLSECPDFAQACRDAGLCFVGPSTANISAMATKLASRRVAERAGVPVVPGSAALADVNDAQRAAAEIGYPVVFKPVAGGGGLGIVPVLREGDLPAAFEEARHLSRVILADDDALYLEKLLIKPRHVEIQIAGDQHGNIIHLGDRDCSVQRRHQKLVEETPSPTVSASLRSAMAEAAVRIARELAYTGLGTVEMLVCDDQFYFLAMNTRLQVEHTVTEEVTGLDLVEWQIRIAMGEELPARQDEVVREGHAIQCRIYAEDPERALAPSHGVIQRYEVPEAPWVRNDVGAWIGDHVSSFYDPLIAKLIVRGPSRLSAVQRMRMALMDYRISGVSTNVTLLRQIFHNDVFNQGDQTTAFLEEEFGIPASPASAPGPAPGLTPAPGE